MPQAGQATPAVGDIATYIDPAHPYNGATYAPPAPVYPPIDDLRAQAHAATSQVAQDLLVQVSGTSDLAAQNLRRRDELLAAASLTLAEQSELASLNGLADQAKAVAATQVGVDAWIDGAGRTQSELYSWLSNGAALSPYASTGYAWPTV